MFVKQLNTRKCYEESQSSFSSLSSCIYCRPPSHSTETCWCSRRHQHLPSPPTPPSPSSWTAAPTAWAWGLWTWNSSVWRWRDIVYPSRGGPNLVSKVGLMAFVTWSVTRESDLFVPHSLPHSHVILNVIRAANSGTTLPGHGREYIK